MSAYTPKVIFQIAIMSVLSMATGYAWYISLAQTPIAANTAIYNSGSVLVYIFSIFILKENLNYIKITAVVVSVIGVVIIATLGRDEEASHEVTLVGYIALIVSIFVYALYEVCYEKIDPRPHDERDIGYGFFFLGICGVCTAVFLWIPIPFLHFAGIEVFSLPSPEEAQGILLTAVLDTVFNAALLLGISFSSPTIIAVGCVLTIPVSMVVEFIFKNNVLNLYAMIGSALILVSVVLVNFAEFGKNIINADFYTKDKKARSDALLQDTIN